MSRVETANFMFLPFHWNTIKIFSVWELQSCQHSFTATTTEDVHVLRLHEHVLRVVTSKLSRVNLTRIRRLDKNILISQASKLIQFRNYWSLERKLSQWSRFFLRFRKQKTSKLMHGWAELIKRSVGPRRRCHETVFLGANIIETFCRLARFPVADSNAMTWHCPRSKFQSRKCKILLHHFRS